MDRATSARPNGVSSDEFATVANSPMDTPLRRADVARAIDDGIAEVCGHEHALPMQAEDDILRVAHLPPEAINAVSARKRMIFIEGVGCLLQLVPWILRRDVHPARVHRKRAPDRDEALGFSDESLGHVPQAAVGGDGEVEGATAQRFV